MSWAKQEQLKSRETNALTKERVSRRWLDLVNASPMFAVKGNQSVEKQENTGES